MRVPKTSARPMRRVTLVTSSSWERWSGDGCGFLFTMNCPRTAKLSQPGTLPQFLRRHAGEAPGVIRITGAFVLGDLRIGTQRASHILRGIANDCAARADDFRGRDAFFHPSFERH